MESETTATVRLFAALRDAAQTAQVEVAAPAPLAVVLADLSARFGERFDRRVQIAAVMIDGTPVSGDDDVIVPAGAEVALLPPFAGGNGESSVRPAVDGRSHR